MGPSAGERGVGHHRRQPARPDRRQRGRVRRGPRRRRPGHDRRGARRRGGAKTLRGVDETGTLVVVPSISFPVVELAKITAVQSYEERMLFVLLMLDDPELRIVFVTSAAVDPATIDYYLRFLQDPASARDRLTLVDVGDPSTGSLSEKI